MMSAKKKWRKISGPNRLPELIQGIEFDLPPGSSLAVM
jgi:putative transposase